MAELTVFSQTITKDAAAIKATGPLNAGGFDTLEDEFSKVLESGVTGLVLDISGLTALSSAGVGAILNLSRMLNDRKGRLAVVSPAGEIRGQIDLLGLADALTLVDSAEQAKKMIGQAK